MSRTSFRLLTFSVQTLICTQCQKLFQRVVRYDRIKLLGCQLITAACKSFFAHFLPYLFHLLFQDGQAPKSYVLVILLAFNF